MCASDLEQFTDLYGDFLREVFEEKPDKKIEVNGFSFDLVDVKIQQMQQEGMQTIVVEHDGELIGFVSFKVIAECVMYIKGFYIKPIFRGMKIHEVFRDLFKSNGVVKLIYQSSKHVVPSGIVKNKNKKLLKILEQSIVWEQDV